MKKGLGFFIVALFALPGAALMSLAMLSEPNAPAGNARGGSGRVSGVPEEYQDVVWRAGHACDVVSPSHAWHRLTMSRHIHGIHRLRARPGLGGLLSSCRPRGPPMGMMGMEMGELTLPTGLIRSIRRACTCASSLRTLTPGLPRACGVSA